MAHKENGTTPRAQVTAPEAPAEGADTAAQARRARFGRLPERVRPQDAVPAVRATVHDPDRDAYNPDEWLVRNVV
ncbi:MULTISPECIES: hypothetical protein [unclassified Streptomyces]|uniref:hypothetical protein n=1 Tax=unclassified Streptomyces TaxID=2593676 RepID=UPI0038022A80